MHQPDLLPCTPLPTSADDTRSGLVGKTGALRDDAAPGWQIARERLFNPGRRSVTTLA